jgi:hypothetical protein
MSAGPSIPLDLKPMSLSELLDRTFTLYRGNFWLFCGTMAVPQVVVAALSIIIYLNPATRTLPNVQPNPQNPFAPLAALVPLILVLFEFAFVASIVITVALGAVTFAVSSLCMGEQASIRKSYSMLRSRFFGLLGLSLILLIVTIIFVSAGLLAGLIVGGLVGGLLALITPILTAVFVFLALIAGIVLSFWLVMRFSVAIPVLLLEGRGVFDSIGRSGILTKGHRWRILAATLVMAFLTFVIRFLFEWPFALQGFFHPQRTLIPLWQQVGSSVMGAISGTLVGSLGMITIVLIYYDVRIRKEAFDLQAMMAAIAQPPSAPAPPTAQPSAPPPAL